jgi:AAA domain/Primase C terminal 1 (PriCT-1)
MYFTKNGHGNKPESAVLEGPLPDSIPDDQQHEFFINKARRLRKYGFSPEEIYSALQVANEDRCITPLPDFEVKKIAYGADEELPGYADIGQLMRDGIPNPEILVPDLVYAGQIHQVWGAPGKGKSIHALYVALQVAEQGKNVLYIDQENARRIQALRLQDMGGDPDMISRHFHLFSFPGLTTDKEDLARLQKTVERINPALIVFDSWVSFLGIDGLDENSSNDIGYWISAVCRPLQNDDRAFWVLDHTPREGDHPRGSSAKEGQVDVSYKYQRVEDFDRDCLGSVMIKVHKDREGRMPFKQKYVMGGQNGRLICYPEGIVDAGGIRLPEQDMKVLKALQEHGQPAGFTEWRLLAGMASKSGFDAIRKRLVSDGYAHKNDEGKYIPDEIAQQMTLNTVPD